MFVFIPDGSALAVKVVVVVIVAVSNALCVFEYETNEDFVAFKVTRPDSEGAILFEKHDVEERVLSGEAETDADADTERVGIRLTEIRVE